MARHRLIIMGAGGRDFHTFNMIYRDDPSCEVLAFTAAQIPFLEGKRYPPSLAGPLYPEGIPIHAEESLRDLILAHGVEEVVFAYSDVSHEDVMHAASAVLSAGADFRLFGPGRTMLGCAVPVISVCAVRTGCGKSLITRKLARLLKARGLRVSVVRHPMVYTDFSPSRKFSTLADIDRSRCTIEEREEFEHLVKAGVTVYAGTDYEKVVEEAERGEELLIWDGGNNDFPFLDPDHEIVLVDALRPGQESRYYPGEVNLRRADLVIITKVNEAPAEKVRSIRDAIAGTNRRAAVVEALSRLTVSDPSLLKGRKVLVIEDGPTVTHGGMPFGAASVAARAHGAQPVDPRPFAVGSLRGVYETYPHLGPVLPAVGYSEQQIADLAATIAATPCDAVLSGTPIDLGSALRGHDLGGRVVRHVAYDLDDGTKERLAELLAPWITRWTTREEPDA
jgi:predicted GTPase